MYDVWEFVCGVSGEGQGQFINKIDTFPKVDCFSHQCVLFAIWYYV